MRAIDELEKLDQVLAAEPDYNFTAVDDWAPDDTRYNEQWGLRGTNGIQAELAWDFTRGDVTPRIQIGIFEGAFQANHEDLRTFTGNFNPNPGAAQNHGTHVAGIIGAIGNNDQGITGVTQAEICLLNRNDFVGSLTWAINHGIRIINASFRYLSGNIVNGIDEPAAAVVNHATAIRNFGSNGGLLIASAGNQGNNQFGNTDLTPQFPGGYGDVRNFPDINNMIAVGSINENGTRSGFSSFGENSVHIYAPGNNILSTIPNDGYDFLSGTSMATPMVTGTAALLRTVNPNLTAVELRDAVLNNGVPITVNIPGGGIHNTRRLNAFRAIGSQVFTTSISGNNCTITGVTSGFTLAGSITIPEMINGRTVTQIGSSAFSGQNQLTRITIPSTVTTIGANAFKNTNDARIDLEGRTSSPSTFNVSWNSSNNPVYLSGIRCYHTSRTLVSINTTTHGERCDKCRTTINITSHTYTNYIWKNYNQHSTTCGCGAFKLQGHAVASGDPGYPYKNCLHCGGPAQYGFVQLGGRIPMIELVPSLFIQEYFGNGSYLLSNGIYVISDEDLDGFYDGTLALPESCDDCHEHLHSSDCEHHATECLDCNSYNCEDNLAYSSIGKTHYILDKKEKIFEFGY